MKVFVYGTLLKENSNHKRYLMGQEFIGTGCLMNYAMYNVGNYPCIVEDGNEKVLGEIYEIDDLTLKNLDILEGEGSLYKRKLVEVLDSKNQTIEVFVYVWNRSINGLKKVEFVNQPWKKIT